MPILMIQSPSPADQEAGCSLLPCEMMGSSSEENQPRVQILFGPEGPTSRRSHKSKSKGQISTWIFATSCRMALFLGFILWMTTRNLKQVLDVGDPAIIVIDEEELIAPADEALLGNSYYFSNDHFIDSTSQISMPIFWLNKEEDTASTKRMTDRLNSLNIWVNDTQPPAKRQVTRIPFLSPKVIKADFIRQDNQYPILQLRNNATLVDGSSRPRKLQGKYSYDEAAKLATHLTAIKRALADGYNQILVLQDDAMLTQDFLTHVHECMALAPRDWTLLQWSTDNVAQLEQAFGLPEPWISWLPGLGGTHAYLISRKGMLSIRHALMQERMGHVTFQIGADYPKVLEANELLFSVDQRAYVSTYPWLLSESSIPDGKGNFGTRLQQSPPDLPLPSLQLPSREESILVFMNIRVASTKRLEGELDRILTDNEALCLQYHMKASKCNWIIQVVLARNHMVDRFEEYRDQFPANMELQVTATRERFNKFALLARNLKNMSQYDLVLFKDNDQRLAGFPWATFLADKGDALIASPLRQTPFESYGVYKMWERRQYYKFHDAYGWKTKGFQPWATDLFVRRQPLIVPFLEMYFNVFDGKYAEWFFSKILTTNYTSQDSSWGPDFLWCPAAKTYAPHRPSCALVLLVSVHEDTRQIHKDGEAFNDRGYAVIEQLRNNSQYDKWYRTSESYAQGVIAWRTLDSIAKECRQKILKTAKSAPLNFTECVRVAMQEPTKEKEG